MVQKVTNYAGNLAAHAAFDPRSITGLGIAHSGGHILDAGHIHEVAAGTLTVPANTSWAAYLNGPLGTLNVAAESSISATDNLIIWRGTSTASTTTIEDVRSWVSAFIGTISFVPLWDTVVLSINSGPEIWYKFDESALPVYNQGSDPAAIDLDTADVNGYATYQEPGVVAESGAVFIDDATSFASAHAIKNVGGATLLNAGAGASGTGTMVWVFRPEFPGSRAHLVGGPTGAVDRMMLDMAGSELTFRIIDNTLTYTVSFDQLKQTGTGSTWCQDGNWHMFAVTHDGSSYAYYYDGVALTPSTIVDTLGTNEWLDTVAVSDFVFGNVQTSGGADQYYCGDVDDWLYYDGYEATSDEVASLWSAISPRVSLAARGAHESIPLVARDLAGLDDHAGTCHLGYSFKSTSFITDLGNATNKLVRASGGCTTYIETGYDKYQLAGKHNASSYLSGTDIDFTLATGVQDILAHTSGYIHCMFKDEGNAATTWAQNLFSIHNNNTGNNNYQVRFFMDPRAGAQYGNIYYQFQDGSGFQHNFIINPYSSNSVDIFDGNWHQIICHQPADGTGMDYYVDGDAYLNVTDSTTGTQDNDIWINHSDNAVNTRLSLGAFGSSADFGIDGWLTQFIIDDADIDATAAANLWAATGL